jgi:hypothetical protein
VDRNEFEDRVERFVELYPSFEDILDVLDITPVEVVTILVSNGYAKLPPFLDEFEADDEQEE